MFKRFTLGKRIAAGMILMLTLMIVVGLVGYSGLTRVLTVMSFSNQIGQLDQTVANTKRATDEYLLSIFRGDQSAKEAAREQITENLKLATEMIKTLSEHQVVGTEGITRLDQAKQQLAQYGDIFGQYQQLDAQATKFATDIDETFAAMMGKLDKAVFRVETMVVPAKVLTTSAAIYFNRSTPENWAKVQEDTAKLGDSINEWYEFVKTSSELSTLANTIKEQFAHIKETLDQYHSISAKQLELRNKMDERTQNLAAACKDLVEMSAAKMRDQARLSTSLIFGFIGAALLIGILYAVFSIKGIVGRLKKVITGVMEGSEQVAAAADQVASAGQSLAEGSSQQAASLEESSSSLEEMSSLTSQNADRAREARGLMAEVQAIVEKVSKHMNDMAEAVAEITRSSEETGKIIRTIDEIAFQTNLLALNAAVEAARAGEAGAGFAVVADEVRNLARRAAEASKNTAYLIEEIVRTIKTGNELTLSTKEAFDENMTITVKVGQLVDEISEASSEQAQGIEQVSRAVAEMNTLTQSNAANAEESAGLAEQMGAQAGRMQAHIEQLLALVGKNGAKTRPGQTADGDAEETMQQMASAERQKQPKAIPSKTSRAAEGNDYQSDFNDF